MGLRSKIFKRMMSGGFSNSSSSVTRSKSGSVSSISRSITKSIKSLSSGSLSRITSFDSNFDEDLWEEYYYEIIEAQQDKAGNAGQETLLGDDYFGNSAKLYCRLNGEDYDPDRFVSYVKNDLGDDYYYAINEIIDECAEELYEAWDRSYSNDGIGEKLFGGAIGSQRRVYGSFSNALAIYQSSATSRGYNFSGTAAANAANRALNKQSLIAWRKNNPNGTARVYASASYINAARKNGKNL
jgi:hypothetical protein